MILVAFGPFYITESSVLGVLHVFRHFIIIINNNKQPFGVDALPQYYHLTSFNYEYIKVRDIGWIVDVIWEI